MTDNVKVLVPTPAAPCRKCVNSFGVSDPDGTVVIVWCEHNRYGGVYTPESGTWEIHGPYQSAQAFQRALATKCMASVALAQRAGIIPQH